jgi:signal peptidase II
MLKNFIKKNLLSFILITIIFFVDRISKIYILILSQNEQNVDIYINQYLNLDLIWNRGIAFGFLSFSESYAYNIISVIIFVIIFTILVMMIRDSGYKKYCYILIAGGASGNLFDRLYYKGVPDFIDLHFNNFHWFIFNVSDIFITIGVICLIYAEIFMEKKKDK